MKTPNNDYLKLQEENLRLKNAVAELSILNNIATAITSTQSLEKVIEMMVKSCIKHLKVEQGAVMLLEEHENGNQLHTIVRKQDSSSEKLPYRFDTQLTGWMMKNKAPLLINEIYNDARFKFTEEIEIPFKTLLSVPILFKGKMIGALTVFNKKSKKGFSSDDQRLLSIIAAQSASVIENARLLQQEQELLRLEEEYRMAKEIQLNILPKTIPSVIGYDISAINISAKDVGGDYYDFIKLSEDRIAFCLGDITGKGMPAAMLMANLQATLRGQTLMQKSICENIKNSNLLLLNSTAENKFATLFFAELNHVNHKLTYCNAGHEAPIIHSSNDIIRLDKGGLLLGCFDFAEYECTEKQFEPGEVLLIFSDGITEAMNEKEEEFGVERLITILKVNSNLSSEDIVDNIISEVRSHSSKVEQSDDITLIVVKRNN